MLLISLGMAGAVAPGMPLPESTTIFIGRASFTSPTMRYPRGAGAGVAVQPGLAEWAWGKAQLRRESTLAGDAGVRRVAILAFGTMVYTALQAAQGLDATVVNMRFVKPLDVELVCRLARESDALLDVSGTRGILDLPPSSKSLETVELNSTTGKTYVPVELHSNGGRITLTGARMLYSDATLIGRAGGVSAAATFARGTEGRLGVRGDSAMHAGQEFLLDG